MLRLKWIHVCGSLLCGQQRVGLFKRLISILRLLEKLAKYYLAYIPDAMRLSAFLTKSPVNLPMLYKMIRVDIADLLNFVAASHVTNLLENTNITIWNSCSR